MKNTTLFSILILTALSSSAQDVVINKSQSQCESDIANSSFGTRDEKKNKDICKTYQQSVINCASDLAKTKKLTYTFEKALSDCERIRTSDHY